MRKSSISSSFATAVATVVVDCAAFAGIALRTFLHLTSMRESMGYWLERYQSTEVAGGWDRHGRLPIGNLKPGFKPGHCPQYCISVLAVCPATSRLAAVRANRQG